MAAWTGIRVRRFLSARSVTPDAAKVKVDLPERAVVRRPRPGRPHLKRHADNRYGADPAILGARILVDEQPFTVIGVAGAGFHGVQVERRAEVWVPAMIERK